MTEIRARLSASPNIALSAGLLIFVFFLLFRVPWHFANPSLIGDDARHYFKYAFEHNWLAALIKQHHGYYNFWANLMGILAAKAFPIERAPYVMLSGSCAIWALMTALIIAPGSPFQTAGSKVIALWLLVLVPPTGGSQIFQICLTHFYFCICAALILISKAHTYKQRIWYRSILVFCGISSPVALFLIPIFGLSYIKHASKDRLIQIGILLLSGALQLLALYNHFNSYGMKLPEGRVDESLHLDTFVFWAFNYSIIRPFLGADIFTHSGKFLQAVVIERNEFYMPMLIGCGLVLFQSGILLYGLDKSRRNESAQLLLASAIIIAMLSFQTGYFAGFNFLKTGLLYQADRYFIVPATFIAWIYIIYAMTDMRLFFRWLYRAIVIWLLITGISTWYFEKMRATNIPNWQTEISLWKNDPVYRLKVGSGGRTMNLVKYPNK